MMTPAIRGWTFVEIETHESRTDPEARLMRKGKGYSWASAEDLMDFMVSRATGRAEREAVPVMLDDARQRGYSPRTLGGDKGYHPGVCQGHA